MARQTLVKWVDDLDGESQADETVEFSIDGISYEIDLSASNASTLRTGLSQWVGSARKVSRRGRRPVVSSTRSDLAAIRSWAKENGHSVSDRGRIPADIIAAYHSRTAVKSDQERAAVALSKVTTVDEAPDFSEVG